MKRVIFLFLFIVFLITPVFAAVTAEDKEQISSQLDILENSVNSGRIHGLENLISPNAEAGLINEINDAIRKEKIDYEIESIDSFKEIEDAGVKVKCSVAVSGANWNMSGFSNFFIFEKVDGNWLIIDTDFHEKLSSDYGLKIFGLVFLIMGAVFLLIIIMGLGIYRYLRSKSKTVLEKSVSVKPAEPEYQGVGIRFLATIIDLTIIFMITILAYTFLLIPYMDQSQKTGALYSTVLFISTSFLLVFPFLYYIILEGWKGATAGKMICQIRVVKEDCSQCDIKSSIIRNLFRLIDGISGYLVGAIVIWSSDKKQRLGDIIAKTVVIKK